MNPRYQTGVLLFGLILPLLVIVFIFGVAVFQKSKLTREFEERKAIYLANQRSDQAAKSLQAQLEGYRAKEVHWSNLLKKSDVGSVTTLLKEISSEYKGGEKFRQKDFKFVNRETGIGASSAQPSITYNISLSGTFQALQESLLSLESQMPNLSLNSIKLQPQADRQLLEAELSYSAWIN